MTRTTPARAATASRKCVTVIDYDMPLKLTTEIITAAIHGFEIQKASIDAKIAGLRAMLPGGSSESAATPQAAGRKRRKVSVAARKRMRDAQRLRWAKVRGESQPTPPVKP